MVHILKKKTKTKTKIHVNLSPSHSSIPIQSQKCGVLIILSPLLFEPMPRYLMTLLSKQKIECHLSRNKGKLIVFLELQVPLLSIGEGNGNNMHSSILAWKIPWTEEPGGLQSIGSPRVGYDQSNLALLPTGSLRVGHDLQTEQQLSPCMS